MSTVKQLPSTVNVECVAGDPFTATFTATSGVTTFSSPATTMTTAGGDAYTTDPGVPTASASGASLSTAWSAADTAALNTTTKPKTYKWSTKAVADGGSSFQWYGGTITVHPVGTSGVSSSTAVTAAVTVGGVSVSAVIIAGTGAASGITVTDVDGNYTGTNTETILAELPARFYPATFVVDPQGNGTHLTLTAACADVAQAGTRVLIKPSAFNLGISEPGAITLPAFDNCTIEGWGRVAPILSFPAGSSGITNAGTDRTGWRVANLCLQGPGKTDGGGGIGLKLRNVTRSSIENVQLISWPIGLRLGGDSMGTLHTFITNPRIVSCGTGVDCLGEAGGANATRIYGGEISSCITGFKGDLNTGGISIRDTSFESNTTAIDHDGSNCLFDVGRFEGNTTDCTFGTNAYGNRLRTQMLDTAKISDSNPAKNIVEQGALFSAPVLHHLELVQSITPAAANALRPAYGANGAFSALVIPRNGRYTTGISFAVGASSGNCQVAITNMEGDVLAKSTATAVGTANAVQTVSFATPVWLAPGRRYRLVLACDNTTATFLAAYSSGGGTAVYAALAADETSRYKASVMSIGSSISGWSSTPETIWLRLA